MRTLHVVDQELLAAMDARDAVRVDSLLLERGALLGRMGVEQPPVPDLPLPEGQVALADLAERLDTLHKTLHRAYELFRLATPFGRSALIPKSNFGHPEALIKGLFRAAYDDGRQHCLVAREHAERLHVQLPDLPRPPIPEPENIDGRVPFPRDAHNAWEYRVALAQALDGYRPVIEAVYRRRYARG